LEDKANFLEEELKRSNGDLNRLF